MTDTDWGDWGQSLPPIEAIDWPIDMTDVFMSKILKYFTLRERLILRMVCKMWKNSVDEAFKSVKTFDTQNVSKNCDISLKGICFLLQLCPNVRKVCLNGFILSSYEDNPNEDNNILDIIVNNCVHLTILDLNSLMDIDDKIVKNAQYFRKLKSFAAINITDKALNCIIDSPNLESLNLKRNNDIERPNFERLGHNIKELIVENSSFEMNSMNDICNGNGKNIERLDIDISDSTVMPLIGTLTQLKKLKLGLETHDFDFTSFKNLLKLECLEIICSDSSKLTIAESNDLIQALNKLKISNLQITLSQLNNVGINDESLNYIYKCCPSLEKLVIRGANSLSGYGMYPISQLNNLRELDLKDCLHITDEIEIVINNCPKLRTLILHNCSHITGFVVNKMVTKAQNLPTDNFYLDVIDTNVTEEKLPKPLPTNLEVIWDYEYCDYDCDHGYGADGYDSDPNYDRFLDNNNDIDFYNEDDDPDYYDDYEDEDIDYNM